MNALENKINIFVYLVLFFSKIVTKTVCTPSFQCREIWETMRTCDYLNTVLLNIFSINSQIERSTD